MAQVIVQRKKFIITGQVQGVGFRPFVFRIATENMLTGTVSNTSAGVFIEVQGPLASVNAFGKALTDELPPLAEVVSRTEEELPVIEQEQDFSIVASTDSSGNSVLISSDVAICEDCLRDIFNPTNHRFLYPFTNCTNCGPRYTITHSIPYDRDKTSMACFTLCKTCHEEYENPLDRRFHAQPNACPACGPKVWLASTGGMTLCSETQAIRQCAKALSKGMIAAIKGLGGFHLACDATSESAVKTLRHRKKRSHKPLAVMVPDIETARELAQLSTDEEALLLCRERPIVLARVKKDSPLASAVHPQTGYIGIMLPYTPLHYILFHLYREGLSDSHTPALVMTSGNMSSEPICLSNREAVTRLEGIADIFLLHDRDILIRTDDSVVRIHPDTGQTLFMRRARGYVPRPIFLAETEVPSNPALNDDFSDFPDSYDSDVKAPYVKVPEEEFPNEHQAYEGPSLHEDSETDEIDFDNMDWDDFPTYTEAPPPQTHISEQQIDTEPQKTAAALASHAEEASYMQEDEEFFAQFRLDAPLAEEHVISSDEADIPPDTLCVFGAGPELKNTLCFTRGNQAFVSQHIGDMQNLETYGFYQEISEHLPKILEVAPHVIVHDLHPDYMTTGFATDYAREHDITAIALQHHYAHIFSVLAENQHIGPALGIALDGTGYGEDGTIWGGELLFVDTDSLEQERLGHFAPIPLPGGETAIREPWRIAQGLLWTLGIHEPDGTAWTWQTDHKEQAAMLPMLLEKQVNTPMTSSCGRLFDAVSAMLGLCHKVTYEGQAAMVLEAAQDMTVTEPYACPLLAEIQPAQLDTHALFLQAYTDWQKGVPAGTIARRFHLGLIHGIAELAYGLAMIMGIGSVGLSGGVMQNLTIATELPRALQQYGLTPLLHTKLPPNDGCISLGQAFYGRQKLLSLL